MTSEANRYELVERIAVGGMAEVFLAKSFGSHGFEKLLAVKRILPHLAADQTFVERFVREAKLTVTLAHANIVQVLDFSRFGESLYIAMEYVDGPDLAWLLRRYQQRGETLPLGTALFIACELLKGLDFAHKRGVVHRDISPSNVLLSISGEVKLTDFGIAVAAGGPRHTSVDVVMGKWPYMSPEQTRGEDLDSSSDVFSVATLLYELFTGERPFVHSEPAAVVKSIRSGPVPSVRKVRSDLPPQLDSILAGAFERDRRKRKATAASMYRDLVTLSYSLNLPATAIDLAQLIEDSDKPEKAAPPKLAPNESLIDAIISSELEAIRPERVTEGAAPPPITKQSGTLTFVTQGKRADGLTMWTIADTPPVRPRTHQVAGRNNRPLFVAAAAIATACGILVALLVFGRERDAPSLATPAVVPARPLAAAPLDAAPIAQALETAAIADAGTTAAVADASAITAAASAEAIADAAAEPPADARPRRRPSSGSEPKKPATEFGKIDLFVKPWANIYWRGKKIGEAPKKGLRLPHGRHRLRLVNPVSNRSTTITVVVPAAKPYRVTLPQNERR